MLSRLSGHRHELMLRRAVLTWTYKGILVVAAQTPRTPRKDNYAASNNRLNLIIHHAHKYISTYLGAVIIKAGARAIGRRLTPGPPVSEPSGRAAAAKNWR